MRRLLPQAAEDVDLDEAYAWPATPAQVVRANMVSSADGAAARDGVTEPISGPADKRVFAVLRGLTDVILVGAGTARKERYGGTRPGAERSATRRAAGLAPVPPIAVVSGRLDLDPAGPLFTDTLVPPIVVTCSAAPADRLAALRPVADVIVAGAYRVEVTALLDALADRGYRHVLCEGGPRLLYDVVTAGRLDELCLTVSPCLSGGPAGRILTGPTLPTAARLTLRQVLTEAGSLFLRYEVGPSPRDLPQAPAAETTASVAKPASSPSSSP